MEDVPAASVASLVSNVPAACVSSPLEDVLSGVSGGGSKLIADLESSASCSQLREKDLNNYNIWHFLSHGHTYLFQAMEAHLSALLLLYAGLGEKLNSDFCTKTMHFDHTNHQHSVVDNNGCFFL